MLPKGPINQASAEGIVSDDPLYQCADEKDVDTEGMERKRKQSKWVFYISVIIA
jgi:hypothetical protein